MQVVWFSVVQFCKSTGPLPSQAPQTPKGPRKGYVSSRPAPPVHHAPQDAGKGQRPKAARVDDQRRLQRLIVCQHPAVALAPAGEVGSRVEAGWRCWALPCPIEPGLCPQHLGLHSFPVAVGARRATSTHSLSACPQLEPSGRDTPKKACWLTAGMRKGASSASSDSISSPSTATTRRTSTLGASALGSTQGLQEGRWGWVRIRQGTVGRSCRGRVRSLQGSALYRTAPSLKQPIAAEQLSLQCSALCRADG